MRIIWIRSSVCAMIGLCIMALGCAHKADLEQSTIPAPQKENHAAIVLDPEKTAAQSPQRSSLAGLGHEAEVFVNQDIIFGYDTADISPATAKILKDKAAFLTDHPTLTVRIEGHCDERGTVEYNLALGDRRARAARDILYALGIEKDRLTNVTYGEEQPLDPGHTEEAWAKNRRAHFVIVNP